MSSPLRASAGSLSGDALMIRPEERLGQITTTNADERSSRAETTDHAPEYSASKRACARANDFGAVEKTGVLQQVRAEARASKFANVPKWMRTRLRRLLKA